MNILARKIWEVLSELNCVVWIEYIWTEVNIADPPSRGEKPPMPYPLSGVRVGEPFDSWVDSF